MPSKVAAIGDIHGCLIELERLTARVLNWFGDQGGTLVLLGDLVDRGPDTRGVLEFVKAWDHPNISLVVIRGNHEEMMIQSLLHHDLQHQRVWLLNGGMAAMMSIGDDAED